MSDVAAGWYPDPTPATAAPSLRYWDGTAWTEHVAPAQQYVSPAYAVLPAGPTTPDGVPLAGYGWRVLAQLIDALVVGVPTFLATLPGQLESQRRMNDLMTQLEGSSPDFGSFWRDYFDVFGDQMRSGLPFMLLGVAYVVVMLRWKGATVGKLAVGLRVRLREQPGRLPWGAVTLRVLVQNVLTVAPFLLLAAGLWQLALVVYLPVMLFGFLDLLWPAWDRKRQALHDKAARTNVVRVR